MDLGDFGFWILDFEDFGFWGFWILDLGDFGFWISGPKSKIQNPPIQNPNFFGRFWGFWILDFGPLCSKSFCGRKFRGFWILGILDFGFGGFWIWGFRILDFGDFGDFGFWILGVLDFLILGSLDFGDFGFWGFWILEIWDFGVWGFWILDFVTNFWILHKKKKTVHADPGRRIICNMYIVWSIWPWFFTCVDKSWQHGWVLVESHVPSKVAHMLELKCVNLAILASNYPMEHATRSPMTFDHLHRSPPHIAYTATCTLCEGLCWPILVSYSSYVFIYMSISPDGDGVRYGKNDAAATMALGRWVPIVPTMVCQIVSICFEGYHLKDQKCQLKSCNWGCMLSLEDEARMII